MRVTAPAIDVAAHALQTTATTKPSVRKTHVPVATESVSHLTTVELACGQRHREILLQRSTLTTTSNAGGTDEVVKGTCHQSTLPLTISVVLPAYVPTVTSFTRSRSPMSPSLMVSSVNVPSVGT